MALAARLPNPPLSPFLKGEFQQCGVFVGGGVLDGVSVSNPPLSPFRKGEFQHFGLCVMIKCLMW